MKDLNIREYNIPLLSEVMVFLKTSNEILKDPKVRQALTVATDTAKIDTSLGYPVLPARGPLLSTQVGYDKTLTQLSYDKIGAQKLLDDAGWKQSKSGIRYKDGKPLTFTLYSQNNREFTSVVILIKNPWKAVGVDVQLVPQSESELQTTISYHNYDSLIFGISVGVDPDVFAYWHSSQADIRSRNRLNLSEYKSLTADKALEAGRTRSDPGLRAIKYRPFLDAWRTDAPAITLYQPRFLYISRGNIFGFDPHSMNTGTDRYANIENWMIHEQQLPMSMKH
jgi:peptide/nickel transport system substrate-binding protein